MVKNVFKICCKLRKPNEACQAILIICRKAFIFCTKWLEI